MFSICSEFNIKFFSFLQPGGVLLRDYVESCKIQFRLDWLLLHFFSTQAEVLHRFATSNYEIDRLDAIIDDYLTSVVSQKLSGQQQFTAFCHSLREKIKPFPFITDISGLLNGIPDVFFDVRHCGMAGNRLIAKCIVQKLVGSIRDLRELRKNM
jgi:hypothetical protein